MSSVINVGNYIMSDKKKHIKVWASDVLGDDHDLKQRLSRLNKGQKVKVVFNSDISVENDRLCIKIVFGNAESKSD